MYTGSHRNSGIIVRGLSRVRVEIHPCMRFVAPLVRYNVAFNGCRGGTKSLYGAESRRKDMNLSDSKTRTPEYGMHSWRVSHNAVLECESRLAAAWKKLLATVERWQWDAWSRVRGASFFAMMRQPRVLVSARTGTVTATPITDVVITSIIEGRIQSRSLIFLTRTLR